MSKLSMSSKVSARFVLWLVSFFGYAVQLMLITNLNIALTDMIEKPINESTNNVTAIRDFEVPRFRWNEVDVGLLLSSIFWVLWISHAVGGTLSHVFGAKIVIGYSIMFASIFNICIPWMASINFKALLVLRIIQGFSVGLAFPSIITLTRYWVPPDEKGKFLTCLLGVSCGAGITNFISGFVIETFHWDGVFYLAGFIGLIWCVAWWYFMYNKPEQHPRILEKEKLYLYSKTKINLSSEHLASRKRIPWSHILKSAEVYINALCQFGLVWIYYIIIIYGPMYIHLFHDLSPSMIGVVSGIPHFVRMIFSISFASIADRLISKKIISVTNIRKLGSFFSNVVTGISLIVLANFGEHFFVAISCIYSIVLFSGAGICGVIAGNVDISPNFGSVIQGLCGMTSHTTGFLIPLLVGYLTLNNDTIEQWQKIFLISSGISISTGIIFILLWSSDVQEWDTGVSSLYEKENECSICLKAENKDVDGKNNL